MTGCSALLCSSRSEKGARLFRFPRDANRKAIWVLNMRRESGWKPTVNSRLCEVNYIPLDINSFYLLIMPIRFYRNISTLRNLKAIALINGTN